MVSELCLVHLLQLCLGLIEFHFHDYTTMFCNVLDVSQWQIFVACMLKVQKLSGILATETLVIDNTIIVSHASATDHSIVMAWMITHLVNNGI